MWRPPLACMSSLLRRFVDACKALAFVRQLIPYEKRDWEHGEIGDVCGELH